MPLTFTPTENEDVHGAVLETVHTEEKKVGWIIRYKAGYMGILGGVIGYPHQWPSENQTDIESVRTEVTEFFDNNEELHLMPRTPIQTEADVVEEDVAVEVANENESAEEAVSNEQT